jgi:hypothetical protein
MTEIICLTNSLKHSDRCIAGIDPSTGRWIRPVTKLEDGRIPANLSFIDGEPIKPLDIIDIPLSNLGHGYECENRLIAPGKWNRLGKAQPKDVLHYRERCLLHNNQEEWLSALPYTYLLSLPIQQRRTLQLIQTDDLRVWQNDYGKWKGSLSVLNSNVRLTVNMTDPELRIMINDGYIISRNCLVTLSFAQPWRKPESTGEMFCYRLIAGIIELREDELSPMADMIAQTDIEIERIGWDVEQGREHLIATFQKVSRKLLTLEELQQFLNHLRSLPNSSN